MCPYVHSISDVKTIIDIIFCFYPFKKKVWREKGKSGSVHEGRQMENQLRNFHGTPIHCQRWLRTVQRPFCFCNLHSKIKPSRITLDSIESRTIEYAKGLGEDTVQLIFIDLYI